MGKLFAEKDVLKAVTTFVNLIVNGSTYCARAHDLKLHPLQLQRQY